MTMATLRCPECGARVPAPGIGHRPEESVVCPTCETHFHVPDDAPDDGKAAGSPNASGEKPAEEALWAEQIQAGRSDIAVAAPPKKRAKPSGLGACLLACVALGIAGIVIVVAVGVGIHFVLGEEFVDDLLILARGVQPPPKSDQPDIKREVAELKPEPKELPDRVIGAWAGQLPNGDRVTLVYLEKNQCTIIRHRGKTPPQLTPGTWKVSAVDGGTLRVHREFAKAPAGDLFAADVTVTFPGANEMEHSLGQGTIRCRRE